MKFIGKIRQQTSTIFAKGTRFLGDIFYPSVSSGSVASDKFLGLDASNKLVTTTGGVGGGTLNSLTDVSTTGAVANNILVHNGTSFEVASMQDMVNNPALFTFSFNTFNDNLTTIEEMGPANAQWKAQNTMDFDASYTAGPPNGDAEVFIGNNTTTVGNFTKIGEMTNTAKTQGTNNVDDVNYPSARGNFYIFQLRVTHTVDSTTTTTSIPTGTTNINNQRVFFQNRIYFGTDNNTGLTNFSGLTSVISASFTTTRNITSSNKYIYLAYPNTYTPIPTSADSSATNGFKYGGIMASFTLETSSESISNTRNFSENYKIFRSTNKLSNSLTIGGFTISNNTLNLSTSPNSSFIVNHIFCGLTTSTSVNSITNFASCAQILASNTVKRTWTTVNAGAGQYILFAWPSRLENASQIAFIVGGFEGGFDNVTTGTYENSHGYTEEYRFFRSGFDNLGSTTVTTQTPS